MVSLASLSSDQAMARQELRAFATDYDRQQISFAGLAGTGKTTVAHLVGRELIDMGYDVAFAAPTGKAASVLRRKGVAANTLCSLIYNFAGTCIDLNDNEVPIFRPKGRKDVDTSGILIMDEASMVNKPDYVRLMRLGWRTIWVGDHGQLSPIGGDPGLMRRPNIRLEKIHRQAEGSNILKAAYFVRSGGVLRREQAIPGFTHRRLTGPNQMELLVKRAIRHDSEVILCGYNDTRHRINELSRWSRGCRGVIQPGEPLCCRLNAHQYGWMNGEVLRVKEVVGEDSRAIWVVPEGYTNPIGIWRKPLDSPGKQKTAERDPDLVYAEYGYAITVHSAQGSEWRKLSMIVEPVDDPVRWTYTGLTRCSDDIEVYSRF